MRIKNDRDSVAREKINELIKNYENLFWKRSQNTNTETDNYWPLVKDVTKMSYYEINPSRTSEYILVARNNISQAEVPLSVGVRQLPKMELKFADALAKIEMPSCDVNLSFLSESLKKARVDEWMMTQPIENIRLAVWRNTIVNRFKAVANLFRR